MNEEIGKKLDEIAQRIDEEKKAKKFAAKQEEDERSRLKHEFQQEKENVLKEINAELAEFEPKLLLLRHNLIDNHPFSTKLDTQFTIVATQNRKIEVFASGKYNGNLSINYLASKEEFQSYILEILRSFLSKLKQFEKYYADNVEKHLK